jgi:hypothetical protein
MGHVSRISSWQRGLHAALTYASDDGCSRGLLSIICSLSCATAYNTINAHTHTCVFYISMCARIYIPFCQTPSSRAVRAIDISVRWRRWVRVLCVFLKTWNIILFFRHKHSSCCSSGLLSIDGSLSCIRTLSFAGGLPKRFDRCREFVNFNLGHIETRLNSQIRLISFLITFTIFLILQLYWG